MIDNELLEFFIYFVSGIAISIFFDIFRVLRKSIKTTNTLTYIEDFIFWVIVGAFLVWEIFTISYGYLRSYIFIGLTVGVIFYLITLSKYFININIKILNKIKKIIIIILLIFKNLSLVLKKIIKPILKLIKKPIYFLCINFKKKIQTKKTLFDRKQ